MDLQEARARIAAVKDRREAFFADLALRWLKKPQRVASSGDDQFMAIMVQAAQRAAARAPCGGDALLARVDLGAEDVVTFAANESGAREELACVGRCLMGPLYRYRQTKQRKLFVLIDQVAENWTDEMGNVLWTLVLLRTVQELLPRGTRSAVRKEFDPLFELRDSLRRDLMDLQAIHEETAARYRGRNISDLTHNFDHNNMVFAALRSIVSNRAKEVARAQVASIEAHDVRVDGFEPAASLAGSHREEIKRRLGIEDFDPYSALIDGSDGDRALELAVQYRNGKDPQRELARAALLRLLQPLFDNAGEALDFHASVLAAARARLSSRNKTFAHFWQLLERKAGAEGANLAPSDGDDDEQPGMGIESLDFPIGGEANDDEPSGATSRNEESGEDILYWQRLPAQADVEAERRGEASALLSVSAATQLLVLAKKYGVAFVPMAGQPRRAEVADLAYIERKLVYAASSATLKQGLGTSSPAVDDEPAILALCKRLAEAVHPVLAAGQEKGGLLRELLTALCKHWREHVPTAADQLSTFQLNARGNFALTRADDRELARWAASTRAECAAEPLPRKFLLRYLLLDRETVEGEDEPNAAPGETA